MNIDKLHTTELGVMRIKRNLSLDTDEVVEWCKAKISHPDAVISRQGKNWYVAIDGCIITVNAHSHTIITAHIKERNKKKGERKMKQAIVHIALVVKDYDEAIAFYTKKLRFSLVEDTYQSEQDKRWVVVSPPGSNGTTILLAKASKPEQVDFIGNQSGGRVFLFLGTDDFWRDYNEMVEAQIEFVREPKEADYGTVAVFKDLYGNLWDLVQFNEGHPMGERLK